MGFFSSKKTTYDPMSAYTPQQRASIEALMSLASTGSGGGITLGDAYTGNLGYYDQTAGEKQALAGLQSLLSGGSLDQARSVYSKMADTTFNPEDPTSGYAAFSKALAKSGRESADVLNREAAMTGSRIGTGIQRAKSDLAEDLQNQRATKLAELYNLSQNRALQGAAGLQSLAGTQADLYNRLASQAQIERLLKDQQAKDAYQEYQRQQQEQMTRIGLMQEQWQNPMGSITKKTPGIGMAMLGEVMPVIGSYNTHKYGYTTNQTGLGDAVKAITSMFSGGMGGFGGSTGTSGVNINAGGGGGYSGVMPEGAGVGSGMFL